MMMNNPTMLSYIRREQPVLERLLSSYPRQITDALADTPQHPQHWLILATGSRINAANTARLYMQKTAALQVTVAAADLYLTYEEADPSVDVIIGISLTANDPTMLAAIKKRVLTVMHILSLLLIRKIQRSQRLPMQLAIY